MVRREFGVDQVATRKPRFLPRHISAERLTGGTGAGVLREIELHP
jgi:hypothetical protein